MNQYQPFIWLCAVGVSLASGSPVAPFEISGVQDWRNCKTALDVCTMYPSRVQVLMDGLDLDRPGLEQVKAAVGRSDYARACEHLLTYYKGASGWQAAYRRSIPDANQEAADAALSDVYTLVSVTGTVPRNANGGLRWEDNGPTRDVEFRYELNRHYVWGRLVNACRSEGSTRYAEHLDLLIRDWVIHNPAPPNDATWRILEAGTRVGEVWPQVFYKFLGNDRFLPATAILMLSSMVEHGRYLRASHSNRGNHAAFELRGLAHLALAFPEFRTSEEWYSHAAEGMLTQLRVQFYPDGVLRELAAHYHRVALTQFDSFARSVALAGRATDRVYRDLSEAAWGYVALSMRPTGGIPLDGDSDLDSVVGVVLAESDGFGRPDWRYVATNGREGQAPAGPPSVSYPWAGQLISRSGWQREAHWSFFNAGPARGSRSSSEPIWHQHYDKLHLSVSAHGRDLLVDSGRFSYSTGLRSSYFIHSRAHNVVLVDGQGQGAGTIIPPAPTTKLSVQPDFDFGVEDTGDTLPNAVHTRAVVYLRGKYWVVVDRVQSGGAREINPLWHFHPNCTVAVQGGAVTSVDAGNGNVRVKPVSSLAWDVRLVHGQTSPTPQGWYSPTYSVKLASTCAEYRARIDGTHTFAWVIYPALDTPPDPAVRVLSDSDGVFAVRVDDGKPIEVIVNMTGKSGPITLSNGSRFEGRCAVLGLTAQPQVALGRLLTGSAPLSLQPPVRRDHVQDRAPSVEPTAYPSPAVKQAIKAYGG